MTTGDAYWQIHQLLSTEPYGSAVAVMASEMFTVMQVLSGSHSTSLDTTRSLLSDRHQAFVFGLADNAQQARHVALLSHLRTMFVGDHTCV